MQELNRLDPKFKNQEPPYTTARLEEYRAARMLDEENSVIEIAPNEARRHIVEEVLDYVDDYLKEKGYFLTPEAREMIRPRFVRKERRKGSKNFTSGRSYHLPARPIIFIEDTDSIPTIEEIDTIAHEVFHCLFSKQNGFIATSDGVMTNNPEHQDGKLNGTSMLEEALTSRFAHQLVKDRFPDYWARSQQRLEWRGDDKHRVIRDTKAGIITHAAGHRRTRSSESVMFGSAAHAILDRMMHWMSLDEELAFIDSLERYRLNHEQSEILQAKNICANYWGLTITNELFNCPYDFEKLREFYLKVKSFTPREERCIQCPNCHQYCRSKANYCNGCGTQLREVLLTDTDEEPDQTAQKKDTNKPTRRAAIANGLKLAFGAAVYAGAVAAVAQEGAHEIELHITETFDTEHATWKPLYEAHRQHEEVIAPQNLDPKIAVLFVEGPAFQTDLTAPEGDQQKSDLTARPQAVFSPIMETYDVFDLHQGRVRVPRIPADTLEFMKEHNIALAVGDVSTMLDGEDISFDQPTFWQFLREKFGTLLATYGALIYTTRGAVKALEGDPLVARRLLLKSLVISAFGLGYNEVAPKVQPFLHAQTVRAQLENDPLKRVWARFSTIESALSFEELNDFFREVVHANKLLTLAKHLRSTDPDEKKPTIAYNWHLGHRGIEDFLRLGQDFTRQLILLFPDEVLRKIIAANLNDPRSLYTIRIVQTPNTLRFEDKRDGRKFSRTIYYQEEEIVEDVIIEDLELKKALQERCLISPP